MANYKDGTYTGERALFALKDADIVGCTFEDGESPLKESRRLRITNTTFKWKYPIWYSDDVSCHNVIIEETARSGIWYTKNIRMPSCGETLHTHVCILEEVLHLTLASVVVKVDGNIIATSLVKIAMTDIEAK